MPRSETLKRSVAPTPEKTVLHDLSHLCADDKWSGLGCDLHDLIDAKNARIEVLESAIKEAMRFAPKRYAQWADVLCRAYCADEPEDANNSRHGDDDA